MPLRLHRFFIPLLLLLALANRLDAADTGVPGVAASSGTPTATAELVLNTDALKPGQHAMAAVVVDVPEGYHAQSSTPLTKNLIPFTVTLSADKPLVLSEVLYQPGDIVDFPALKQKFSAYEGQVLTYVPFVVPADASAGDITLTAKIRLQICDDAVCYRPATVQATLATRIVVPETATDSTHADTFAPFDPAKWLPKPSETGPASQPTTKQTNTNDVGAGSIDPAKPQSDAQTTVGSTAYSAASEVKWIAYTDAVFAELRQSGRPILVKFTAAWCLNCHVVERRVFGDDATIAELARRGIALVKVDITEQDAPGSDLLSSLNPAGTIPLTAVYFPGVEKPALLDGIYSSRDLFSALDDGGKTASSLTSIFSVDLKESALPVTIGVAFLVGIVLNIVPCVLPVLPIKAVGFYEAAKHSRARSMLYGGAFSIGIISAFAALAIAVPLFGLNWGEWISNRWFAGVLSFVLLLAAAQSLGLLEFVLPASVNQFDASHDTLMGNFLWGLMTAVLSTPCTIGMFSAVITVALSLGTLLGTLVMVAVGVGMASPYFLLSAFPEAARNFPRTGPWPNVVKQMMGFILIAIALFFVQPVLPISLRGNVVWWMIFACVVASAIFLLTRTVQIAPRTRPIAISSFIGVVLVGLGLFLTLQLVA